MATLLNGVNEVLKRVQAISSDLTTLTSGGKQIPVNIAIQMWNETNDALYDLAKRPFPQELAESSITLVTSDRDYSLASGMNKMRWPLIDQTNGTYITEYPGGYTSLFEDQPIPANYTGLPQNAAIRETDGLLYLDRIPTSNENGRVYAYQYDKDLELTVAADTFPFKAVVFRALVPAVAQRWKYQFQNKFDEKIYNGALATAVSYLTQTQKNESWLPQRAAPVNQTDPYAD